jgi:hypothetical protein
MLLQLKQRQSGHHRSGTIVTSLVRLLSATIGSEAFGDVHTVHRSTLKVAGLRMQGHTYAANIVVRLSVG